MIMQEILVIYKKLDKNKRKNLFKSTVSYVLKSVFLLCCFIAICFESDSASSNNTRTLIGNVDNIEITENHRMYDVIKITINDETFPFVWGRLKKKAEVLDEIYRSDIVSITVKKDRWLFSFKDKYVERVVDIRDEDNVFYDIEHYNRMRVIYFIISTIAIVLFEGLFTFWYYLNIKFFVDKVIMKNNGKKKGKQDNKKQNNKKKK